MEFIRVENNIVVELISCASKPDLGVWFPVNLSGGIHVGDDVRLFDAQWQMRPFVELVAEGLVLLLRAGHGEKYPEGTLLEKVEDNRIVAKNDYDFAKEGLLALGALNYLDDDTKTIKTAASVDELIALDKVTKEKADELKAVEIRGQRDYLLKKLDLFVSNPLRWESLSADEKTVVAGYRQDLLDVPQQQGFPWTVSWPQEPF